MRKKGSRRFPPAAQNDLVIRGRLVDRINAARAPRIALVQAPAGYGKTTLLAQWFYNLSASAIAAAWAAIERPPEVWRDVYDIIVDALAEACVDVTATREILANGELVSPQMINRSICSDLFAYSETVWIFIDDLHLVQDRKAYSALSDLINWLPTNAHIAIASRELPDIPMARLRAQGELMEFYASDLRFAETEIGDFLFHIEGTQLSESEISEAGISTEGWAAGLRLLSFALKDGDRSVIATREAGRRRRFSSFFAEEVFDRRSPRLQRFLLLTSCLDRFSSELADFVTGESDSAELLREIEVSGLFMVALDQNGDWFRYHHLFGEYLRQRLLREEPDLFRLTCARASEWLSDRDMPIDAFNHAMRGGGYHRAASVLERECTSMFYSGSLDLFAALSEQLPNAVQVQFPMILLNRAWMLIIQWRFHEAEEVLLASRRLLEQGGPNIVENKEALNFLQLHREMMLALFKDNMSETGRLLADLDKIPGVKDPYILGSVFVCRLYCGMQSLRSFNSEPLRISALQHFKRSGSIFVIVWLHAVLALTYTRQGHLRRAEETLAEAMELATRVSGVASDLAAIPGLLMAELHYEADRLEEAADLISRYGEIGRSLGYVDQRIASLRVGARLRVRSDSAQPLEWLLADVNAFSASHGFERLQLAVLNQYLQHYIAAGRLEDARRLARSHAVISPEATFPTGASILMHEARALVAARVAHAEGDLSRAANLAARWAEATDRAGWRQAAAKWGILAATFNFMADERNKGVRALGRAIELGRESGLCRSFLDAGDVIMSALVERVQDGSANDLYVENLVAKWNAQQGVGSKQRLTSAVASFDESDVAMAIEALTQREVEILRRLGLGQTNAEIASAVGLTVGSVKWYLNRVYGKIGVSRRVQAAKRAKQLGLI